MGPAALLATRRRSSYAAMIVVAVMLALLAATGTAKAAVWEGHMPAKTWGTNGAYTSLSWVSGWDPERYTICTTAAEYSGGWSFPYGWTCGGESTVFTASGGPDGYPAVDNPNSREFRYAVEYW